MSRRSQVPSPSQHGTNPAKNGNLSNAAPVASKTGPKQERPQTARTPNSVPAETRASANSSIRAAVAARVTSSDEETDSASDIVSAIEAAAEILAQAQEFEQSPGESGFDCDVAADENSFCEDDAEISNDSSDRGINDISPAMDLRQDLRTLADTLREEFRHSISELQAAQAAAIMSQSEVLRALTEMIYQTAGSHEVPTDALERAFSGVEDRLIARMEAMTSGLRGNSDSSSKPGSSPAKSAPVSPVKLKNAASSVTQSWEQIRSEMMAKSDLDDENGSSSDSKCAGQLPEVAQLSSDRHFRLPDQDPSLEIPPTVDPAKVSHEELRDAFLQREAFITTLIARIRRQQDLATGQLSPDQLRSLVNDLPEELASQVRHTLKQMEDLARMGELELSLERARIARQVNQLEHSRQTIEFNARQLGLSLNADGTLSGSTSQPGRGSSSRRWLGKLGFGQ